MAQSNTRLLGHIFASSSSHRWWSTEQRGGHDSSEDNEVLKTVPRITTTLKMTLMTVKTERKGKISLQMGLEEYWLFQSSPNHSKSSLHKHERMHRYRIRWKRLWFRRWRGTYPNVRWSQATMTTWTTTNQHPNGNGNSQNVLNRDTHHHTKHGGMTG